MSRLRDLLNEPGLRFDKNFVNKISSIVKETGDPYAKIVQFAIDRIGIGTISFAFMMMFLKTMYSNKHRLHYEDRDGREYYMEGRLWIDIFYDTLEDYSEYFDEDKNKFHALRRTLTRMAAEAYLSEDKWIALFVHLYLKKDFADYVELIEYIATASNYSEYLEAAHFTSLVFDAFPE